VARGEPILTSGLRVVGDQPGLDRILYRSTSWVHPCSPGRTANACLWKSASFVPRTLSRRVTNADAVPGENGDATGSPGNGSAASRRPDVLAVGRILGRLGWEAGERLATRLQWRLAVSFGAPDFDPPAMREIAPPSDRFWADPFPVAHAGRFWIFFEELLYTVQRGTLAVAEIDARGRLGPPASVLEKPHHLSYPCVFPWRGEWFMVPETSANRTVEVYRARSFPHEWELHDLLLDGVEAVDATPFEFDGHWWMFANIAPVGGSTWDELHLFHAPGPLGPWTPHPRNPVRSDVAGARPAGRPFVREGQLYRPGQVCGGGYGRAVIVHRVRRLDAVAYEEEPAWRVEPGWRPEIVGIHTLNQAGALRVIDYLVRVPRWRRDRTLGVSGAGHTALSGAP
jgi:hypothetical protein